MKSGTQDFASNSSPPRKRWRWVRVFYQFSLRTLLAAMTLAAVVCWWFLRPEVLDEELAGKHLTLRRQVKLVPVDQLPPSLRTLAGDTRIKANVGLWQLRNEFGDLLVAGRYQGDMPHGKWTTWHASGRKATEGYVLGGARTGLWRVWDENGHLRSEATYRVVGIKRQIGGLPPGTSKTWIPGYVSQRHGPARTWWPGGKVRCAGAYADDKRSGMWTWFDEGDHVVRTATY